MGYRDTEAERARQRMLDDWTAARTEVRGTFEDLVHEKVDANESFIIFQNFITGQLRVLEAKLHRYGGEH